MIRRYAKKFNRVCIKPRSTSPDDQRREYIFNVLIGFFTLAAAATTISSGINHLMRTNAHQANSVPVTVGFLLVSAGLWWISRKGHYKVGAYCLIGLVWLAGFQLALTWSIELPMAQLMSVLVIVLAGIMISSRAALFVTLATSVSTLVLGYVETHGDKAVNVSWLTKKLEFSDAIGLVVIYMIVGAISWLSNNEIDNLLRRAWLSEATLAKERDQLEIKVAERTKELERIQLERTLELQNLAEYGQISASLIHDLATPVSAASMSLEQVNQHLQSTVMGQALLSIRHIQDYIASARKQLQGTSRKQKFHASKEIHEIVSLLTHQARAAGVTIRVLGSQNDSIVGDVAAFNRVIANMIVNSIHAYNPRNKERTKQPIKIQVLNENNMIVIAIQDSGVGIKATDMPHIFEEFYSTKKRLGRGLGLGLSTAKRVIEHEFGGTISVTSSPKTGTTFTIGIPHHERTNSTKHTGRRSLSGRQPNLPRQV